MKLSNPSSRRFGHDVYHHTVRDSDTEEEEETNQNGKANDMITNGSERRQLFSCCARIGIGCCARIGIGIGLVAVVLALLGAFVQPVNDKFWEASCGLGILVISDFDIGNTKKYHQWYNEDSTLQLAQSGTFVGPSQMAEYIDFIQSIYFQEWIGRPGRYRFQVATKDRCLLEYVFQTTTQIKPEYSATGEGQCMLSTIGVKLDYTVGLFGFGFNVKKLNIFFPEKYLETLFNDIVGGEAVTDYICDTILRDHCQDVYEANGLDEETCRQRYNSLPPVDEYGYVDGNTKGCRILHSAFAEINNEHCPHMSFIPIEDHHGDLWCQESGGVKAEDLFSEDELAFFKDYAIDSGFDEETLSKTCNYTNSTL